MASALITHWKSKSIYSFQGSPEPIFSTLFFHRLFDTTDPDMYDGAKFSYDGDFLGYLGLEDMGIFTNHDKGVMEKISEMVQRM